MKINEIVLTDEQLETVLNCYRKRQVDKTDSSNNKERTMQTRINDSGDVHCDDAVYYQ